jgi:hypothetical protein
MMHILNHHWMVDLREGSKPMWSSAASGLLRAIIGGIAAIAGGFYTEQQKEHYEIANKRCEMASTLLGKVQGSHFAAFDLHEQDKLGILIGLVFSTLPLLDDASFKQLMAAFDSNKEPDPWKRADHGTAPVFARLSAISQNECGMR